MNFAVDEDVRRHLIRLVPPRRRSRLVNEALLRLEGALAMERLIRLRRQTVTETVEEIVSVVRQDRAGCPLGFWLEQAEPELERDI